MTPVSTGLLAMVLLLLLMAAGTPIGFAMLFVGTAGFAYLVNGFAAINILATTPYNIISNYDYSVIPLFLFMASVCLRAGLANSLFRLLNTWIGWFPGGLASATIGACAIFAAASSSSLATAVTMGMVAIPEMKKYRYNAGLATACVAAGGGLGILIPPSGVLIIYGIITEQSIGKLFIAGIIPGLLLTLLFMGMIFFRARKNPELAPAIEEKFTFSERLKVLGESAEMIILVILIITGLMLGWFTPTEGGAVGAFGAIAFSLFRRRLNWEGFKEAVVETIRTSGMIFTILIGAMIFNTFLAVTTIPMEMADIISGFNLPSMVVLVMILLLYLLLGCFIDALSMILLTIPIFYPLIINLNFDPIWFGIVIVMVIEMALITPPIGMNVYVISGITKDVSMPTIFKGIVPFLIVEIVLLILLIAFPQIVLFLPNIVG